MPIQVGSVEVDIVPSTRGIYARLRRELEPIGRRVGDQLGQWVGDAAARQISRRIAEAVRDGVRDGGRMTTTTAARHGDDAGGAFGRTFQNRVRAAMASLPRADVRLSDTGFNADLARLRSRLETLADRRIGVDVDAATALAEIDRLDRQLAELGASHPDIQVRMDTGRARAELAALRAQINAVDRDEVTVRVNTRGALRAVAQLGVAIGGLAALPAVPVLAAGFGSIAAAATAAGVGVAAFGAAAAPAISDITAALEAQATAEEAVATGAENAAEAQAEFRRALREMQPATRETFHAFVDLRHAFQEWSRSLQPDVMPVATRALDGLRNSLPGLTPFVREAADAIGDLQDRISRGLDSEGWRRFRDDLQNATGPAIRGLGNSAINIGIGLGGIVGAFLPHMDSIADRMESATARFADWGQSLRGSPQFAEFLAYAAEMAPQIGEALGSIARAMLEVGRALGPLAGPALAVLGALADTVGWLATTFPGLIQALYLAMVATRVWTLATIAATAATRAWTVATAAWNAVMLLNPIVRVTLLIGALVAAVVYAYSEFDWFRGVVQAAWRGIQTAARWAWENVLRPTFRAIGDGAVWLWENGIGPVFRFIRGTFRTTGDVATWLWRRAVRPALTGIGDVIGWTWRNAIRPTFRAIRDLVTGTGDVFRWLWREVVRPVWGWIGDRIGEVWRNGIRPTFNALREGVRAVRRAFESARDGIRTAWNALRRITRAPVAFVVNRVYNDGIRRVWNLVVRAFGGEGLDRIDGWATGGVLPGYTPGRDVHRYVSPTGGALELSGGEAIMRPEWTRAVGPGYVHEMNAAARRGGVGGVRNAIGGRAFALGGIFDGIGDVASGAWDAVKEAAGWLTDGFGSAIRAGVRTVVNPLIDLIPGDGRFGQLLRGGARAMVDLLLGAGERGDELATPRVDYRPSAGVEQWRPVVVRALRAVGQSTGLADTTLRRMQQESGGNPRAVNAWDINWMLGHPSVGLMQVIRPTFQAYAGRYRDQGPFLYGVSVDPMANIYASMRYALSRYGSLSSAYNRPGGYDSGGWLAPGQLGYNGLDQPEAVLTPSQWRAISTLAQRGADQPTVLEGDLYLDSGQFLGTVRGVVRQEQQQLATALRAGRR